MEYQTELDFFDTAALACRNSVSCETLDVPSSIVGDDDDENLFNKLYNLVFDTPCIGMERAHEYDVDNSNTNSSFVSPTTTSSFVTSSVSSVQPQLLLSLLPSNLTVLSEQLPIHTTPDGVLGQGQHLSNASVNTKEIDQQIVEECKNIHGLLQMNLLCQKHQAGESLSKSEMDAGLMTSAVQTTLLSPFQSIYHTKFDHGNFVSCVNITTLDEAAKADWGRNTVGLTMHDKTCTQAVSPTTELRSTDATAAAAVVVPMEPLRPLSAYNYFFREERERILTYGTNYDKKSVIRKTSYTREHQNELLTNHWNQDRTSKRRHRKTHGKISFAALSKLVSQSWKELPEEHKNFYKEVASNDWSRYQKDFTIYKNNLVSLPITNTHTTNATTNAATSPIAIEP